jgi:hypothetical protein
VLVNLLANAIKFTPAGEVGVTVTSRYARLEKSIVLASAISYQNHPQRIVNVGGIAAMLQLANNAIFHALKSLGYGVIQLFKPLLRVGLRNCRECREQDGCGDRGIYHSCCFDFAEHHQLLARKRPTKETPGTYGPGALLCS